jgi:hypothetical protein
MLSDFRAAPSFIVITPARFHRLERSDGAAYRHGGNVDYTEV